MARTAAQIQKELDAIPSGQYLLNTSTDQQRAQNATSRENSKKRAALQAELQQAQYSTHTIEGAAQTAMEETQRRAAEDRKLALAGVTEREIKALDAISGGRESALEAITSGRTDALASIRAATQSSLGAFGSTDELMEQLRAEISPEREAQMYEQQRTGVEASTQAAQRNLQEATARGDAPGGAMYRMMGDVQSAGQGQMSEVQRNIDLDRYQKLAGITSQSAGIAGQKAGIYGQEGQNLSNIYQGSAGNLASIYQNAASNTANTLGQTGRTLADIYSNTITAVPDYSQVSGIGRTTTPTATTSRFGSTPKTPKKTWNTGNGVWGSKWNMN